MKIYNFRSNIANALKDLWLMFYVLVNMLRLFASSVSNISAVLLFSVCVINIAFITKPTSLFLLPITFTLMETKYNLYFFKKDTITKFLLR